MRRRVQDSVNVQLALEAQQRDVREFVDQVEKQRALADFVGDIPAEPRKKRKPKLDFAAKLDEVEEMLRKDPKGSNGVWQGAKPSHFVALFARWFAQVYGAEDAEIKRASTAMKACTQAARMIGEEFAGDPRGLMRYLAWLFQQAAKWEARARAEGKSDTFRVTWYYAFVGRKALTDYRVAIARCREGD